MNPAPDAAPDVCAAINAVEGVAATDATWAARAAALGERAPVSRGRRFIARVAGQPLAAINTLADVPVWTTCDPATRQRLAVASALLTHREALACELRGARLAPIAAITGEALLDAILAEPAGKNDAAHALPSPSILAEEGRQLLDAALKTALDRHGDGATLALVARAHQLVEANA